MSDTLQYSPHFVQVYKHMRSSLPINQWAASIGTKLPHFKNSNDIYNAVTLTVKIAGGINTPDGSVKIKVAPTDEQWYSKVQAAAQEMVKSKRPVDLVDYTGDCIRHFTHSQLVHAGELDIVHSGRSSAPIRIASAVPPPEHMSAAKTRAISEWIESIQQPVANAIADTLQGCTMAEISAATLADGPVQQVIESTLRKSKSSVKGGITQFMNTYAMDDISKQCGPDAKITSIARSILHEVRGGLAANEPQIRAFHSHKISEALGGDAKPLWSQGVASIDADVQHKDEHSMYYDVAEDAMYSGILGRKIVYTVYRGQRSNARVGNKTSRRRNNKNKNIGTDVSSSSAMHPMEQFYHQHYYPKFKKFPGHVVERFNQKIDSGIYPGSHDKVKDAFLLFSGRPAPLIQQQQQQPEMPDLVPISQSIDMPRLVPISQSIDMPRLVPIETGISTSTAAAKHRLVPIDAAATTTKRRAKLVPIDDSITKHRLVPIDAAATTTKRRAKLVPIDEPITKHRLVPIDAAATTTKCRAKLVPIDEPITKHRLVPIEDDLQAAFEEEEMSSNDPLFGLPTLSQFLKK